MTSKNSILFTFLTIVNQIISTVIIALAYSSLLSFFTNFKGSFFNLLVLIASYLSSLFFYKSAKHYYPQLIKKSHKAGIRNYSDLRSMFEVDFLSLVIAMVYSMFFYVVLGLLDTALNYPEEYLKGDSFYHSIVIFSIYSLILLITYNGLFNKEQKNRFDFVGRFLVIFFIAFLFIVLIVYLLNEVYGIIGI